MLPWQMKQLPVLLFCSVMQTHVVNAVSKLQVLQASFLDTPRRLSGPVYGYIPALSGKDSQEFEFCAWQCHDIPYDQVRHRIRRVSQVECCLLAGHQRSQYPIDTTASIITAFPDLFRVVAPDSMQIVQPVQHRCILVIELGPFRQRLGGDTLGCESMQCADRKADGGRSFATASSNGIKHKLRLIISDHGSTVIDDGIGEMSNKRCHGHNHWRATGPLRRCPCRYGEPLLGV